MGLIVATILSIALPLPSVTVTRTVDINGGLAPLYGTLETPASSKSSIAALILSGSGATDRDGNGPSGRGPNELKQLAQALDAAGIASLRVDKRGIGESAPAAPSETALTLGTYVNDATNWTRWLSSQPSVSCVVLIGHSEGALIAFLVAQHTHVCGIISLEGPGRPLKSVLEDQFKHVLKGDLLAEANADLQSLSNGQSVERVDPRLDMLFRPSVQNYLRSEINVNPSDELSKSSVPALIVLGTDDSQVAKSDYDALTKARKSVRGMIIQGMNHPLKEVGGNPIDRSELSALPIPAALTTAIIKFISSLQNEKSPDK